MPPTSASSSPRTPTLRASPSSRPAWRRSSSWLRLLSTCSWYSSSCAASLCWPVRSRSRATACSVWAACACSPQSAPSSLCTAPTSASSESDWFCSASWAFHTCSVRSACSGACSSRSCKSRKLSFSRFTFRVSAFRSSGELRGLDTAEGKGRGQLCWGGSRVPRGWPGMQ